MIAITLTISGFYSHYNKKEVIYHVTVPKTSSVSKLKICLVSDLHLSSGTYMRQVRKLVKTNCLHAVKVGKRYKVTKNKLLAYLGENEEPTGKEKAV